MSNPLNPDPLRLIACCPLAVQAGSHRFTGGGLKTATHLRYAASSEATPDGNPMSKPALLLVTRNLPPHVGGMERLIWHCIDELAQDFNVHVIGPTGCRAHLPADMGVTEIPIQPLPWFLLRVKLATLWQGLRVRPAVCFAGSGLTAPFTWLAAKLNRAQSVVYLHGLDIEANHHPVYRIVWHWFLRRVDTALVNSHFTRKLALDIGVPASRLHVIHPGVHLPDHECAQERRQAFRAHHGLTDTTPIMLYVGRITQRKGLSVFVQHSLPQIMQHCPDAKLVVVGDEPHTALVQYKGEFERIQKSIKAHSIDQAVTFLGGIDDAQLASAYFAADVLVFPVQPQAHDNEGFGMVAIEAAAHGLPTIAFAAGGVVDAIRDDQSGTLVAANDHFAMQQAVLRYLQHRHSHVTSASCRAFAEAFSWQHFGQQLRQVCHTLIN